MVPSATYVVERPKLVVASCCHDPPAYEPRRMPAAVGLEMPVPPPPAVRVPDMDGARVKAPPELVMLRVAVRPLTAAEDVPRVRAPAWAVPEVCARDKTPVLVMEGDTEPTTVKAEHDTPLEQLADEVETLPKVLLPVKTKRNLRAL